MNKGQMDRWFNLSDRLTALQNRGIVSAADIPHVLKPIRQIEAHNAEAELAVAEMTILRTEQSGRLVGSQLNQNELSQERVNQIVEKGIKERRARHSGETRVYNTSKVTRIS